MKKTIILYFSLLSLFFVSCQKPKVPTNYSESNRPAAIFPDYHDVTVPINIAPLTFVIDEDGVSFVTRITAGKQE